MNVGVQMYDSYVPDDDEWSEICETCDGKGSFGTKTLNDDGDYEMAWTFCEDCEGTGLKGEDVE